MIALGAILCAGLTSQAQKSVSTKAGVEYHRLRFSRVSWQSFHAPTFHIYFPRGYDSLAAFVSRELPGALSLVTKRTGLAPAKKPQVILYPSVWQLYESNIGSLETTELTLPTFVKKGNRLLVAYDGDYQKLKESLYIALVRSIWAAQFQSESLESQLTGRSAHDIPAWYREGAIAYFATGWTPDDEDAVCAHLKRDSTLMWPSLERAAPELAGKALHYYLAQVYFEEAPRGLLFQVRAKKSLRRGMRLLAKRPLDTVLAQCIDFYRRRCAEHDARSHEAIVITPSLTIKKPAGTVLRWLISPDGQAVALVSEKGERRSVHWYSIATGKSKPILVYRLPPWLNAYDADPYPILAFEGQTLWVVVPYRGGLELRVYGQTGNILTRFPLKAIDGLEKVIPLGEERFLLSAHRRGQSDLVVFDGGRGRYTPLTNDPYDDQNPALQGRDLATAVFHSARPNRGDPSDTTRLHPGLYQLEGKNAVPVITDTLPFARWTPIAWLNNRRLLVSTTRSGTATFTIIDPQNPKADVQTLTGTTHVQYLPDRNAVATLKQTGDSLALLTRPIESWMQNNSQAADPAAISPWLRDYRKAAAARAAEDSILRAARDTATSFLSGVLSAASDKANAQRRKDSLRELATFRPQKAKPYVLQLYSAYFSARLSTDYFINRYQPYRAYLGQFKFPEVGGLARGGYSDLFENHHVSLAYRLPSGTEGSDFFINYRNAARRVAWGLTYFRKVESLRPDPQRRWKDREGRMYPGAAKVKTHYYEVSLHRPLSYRAAVALETALRKDRTIFLATDRYSLEFPSMESLWLLNTLSASLDQRQPTLLLGLYKGYSGKVFLDVFKGFDEGESTALAARAKAEHYQPLYKGITLVGSVQGGYSAGEARVLYNTGGIDGAVNPKVDSSIQFSQDAPYAFQTLATPLRGHRQNRLYGDRYALLNAELWVPLFGDLVPLETPLPSINGLQVGLFTDWATAKEGWRRGAQSSSLWSFGWSARTTLAGYPIRVDMGWPGISGKKPLWYLSLSVQ